MVAGKEEKEPFLGRLEEQIRFKEALRNILANKKLLNKVKDWLSEKDPATLPYIFLLYGEGGMGKSRLAQRLTEIAQIDSEFKNKFRVLWLDWQRRKELDYRLRVRDEVYPQLVFEHIYAIFRDEGFGAKFDPYENALRVRAESEAKISRALDRTIENHDDRYAALRVGGAKMLAWLLRTATPGGTVIPEEPTAKLFESIISGGAAGLARAREAATTLVQSTLTDPDSFNLFMLPNETLAYRLADGIRASTAKKPILIVLDTYEIVDRADIWLRVVMKRTGPGTIWIISGRDNLADTRKFGQHSFTGYRADFSSDRLRVFPLGEFSVADVKEYFLYRVPSKPLDDVSGEAIHRATLGIPLAVREAAAIWAIKNAKLNAITGDEAPSRSRDKIVQKMTERFLLHCFDDPNHAKDKIRLYALALARTPDPDFLSAICESKNLEQDLSDLERRHSFVFVDEMRLHDKVSAFLREYLMHEIRRKAREVRGIHERAIVNLETKKRTREQDLQTLEARIGNDHWTTATLDLCYHSFWLEEERGWAVLLPALVGGLFYRIGFASALIETAEPLLTTFTQVGKRRLEKLQSSLADSSVDGNAALLSEVESSPFILLEDGCVTERKAIIELMRGRLFFHHKKYSQALEAFEEAEQCLPENSQLLPQKLGEALFDLASELIWPSGSRTPVFSPEAARILQKVVVWLPERQVGWYCLGTVLSEAGKKEEAISAYYKAIELDPNYAYSWNGLGNVYSDLEKNKEAINAYKKAIELDPKYVTPWNNLGSVYYSLKQNEEAIQAYQKAIELDPTYATPWNNLGILYRRQNKNEEAIEAYSKAVELNPKDATLWYSLGILYSLMGKLELALDNFNQAVILNPERGSYHSSIVRILHKLERPVEAADQANLARPLMEKENNYNRACFEAICGNVDEALKYLNVAIKNKEVSINWVKKDPDFEDIRDDPRFKELIGG